MEPLDLNSINPYIVFIKYSNQYNMSPQKRIYKPRRLKWYELELVLDGAEGYLITNGRKENTIRGNLYFRTPGTILSGAGPFYGYLIMFDMHFNTERISKYHEGNEFGSSVSQNDPKYQQPYIRNNQPAELPEIMNTNQISKYIELFTGIYGEFIKNGQQNQFFLKTYLMQLILMLKAEWSANSYLHTSSRSIRNNYKKVMSIKKYIDSNISSNFSLEDLAGMAGVSYNFFSKIYKKILGETPISYINKNKMILAKKMLFETGKSIKEIAYDCGFENTNYFYELFKKYEEITPSEFRDRHQRDFTDMIE